jgi:formylglycine-generating enzyme required for sulfatase activity
MRTTFAFLFFLGLYSHGLFGQTSFYVRNGCGVNDAEMGQSHYVFDPSDEAVQIIKIIMDANILEPNFTIKSGDVENALATYDNGNRYIIYNTSYVERIKKSAGTDWAAFFVFAHEIGHHLSNHRFDVTDPAKSKEQELKADVFAGGMLYKLGASLEAAQAGVNSVCKERESNTHPPRRARLEAVASGWKRAKDQSGGVQPAPVVIPWSGKLDDEMVFVEGGTFTMGCTEEQGSDCIYNEKPAHQVTVGNFYIGKYEVTQAQWRNVMGSDPPELHFKSCDQCPVENISWNDIEEFIKKLNDQTMRKYRLPTEAEWEYAARGGQKSRGHKYAGSNNLDEVAWYDKNSDDKTHSVGGKKPNELGVYDLSGNVREWCSNWYINYTSDSVTNPFGPGLGSLRVFRGGSWDSNTRYCRSLVRLYSTPGDRLADLGFRLASSPK